MFEKIKLPTVEQEQQVDKHHPKVIERFQSGGRAMLLRSAGLTKGDIDALGRIGDIKKTFDENGKPKYAFNSQGQKFEAGYQYTFYGDKNGVPYLRVDGVTVGETGGREVREAHRKLDIYENILQGQRDSAEETQAFINERPDLLAEQAKEGGMIKEEGGKSFLDMISKLSGQKPLG